MPVPEHRSPAVVVAMRGATGEELLAASQPDRPGPRPPRPAARVEPARRILLLRSGRHLRVAMETLAVRFPGCHIGVVGTPGSQAALQQAGIGESDTFLYERPRFLPAAFFFSRTALAVRRWRYDQVALLWNDPDGQGQGNVDRTALVMSPGGYLAVTPDGTIVVRKLWPQLRTEALRVLASLAVGAVLGVFLYGPALAITFVRQLRRPRNARPNIGGAATAPHEGAPYAPVTPADGAAAGEGTPDARDGQEQESPAVVLPFKRPEARR
jgi:hypothetical protein